MTECCYTNKHLRHFGYKSNKLNKTYAGSFDLVDHDDYCVICSLKVYPRYRNKGYATRMLTEFLQQFNSNKPLYLYVYKTNEIAIRLYKKVGFVIVGEWEYNRAVYKMQYVKQKGNDNHD